MERLRKEGYKVKDACEVLGISRSGYYSFSRVVTVEWKPGPMRDEELIERLKAIKAEHPFWGYRRVTAWLRNRKGVVVNHKKVHKLMKENGMVATQAIHKAKRRPERSKPRAESPRQFWGIDMTKFMVPVIGWVYLVIVLDWYTKKIVG